MLTFYYVSTQVLPEYQIFEIIKKAVEVKFPQILLRQFDVVA